jgi:hypothetical protein
MEHYFNRYSDSQSESDSVSESETYPETEPETESETEIEYTSNTNIVNTTKFQLLIPEIYNKYIHGKTNDSDPNIDSNYIVLQTFCLNHSNNVTTLFKYMKEMSRFYKVYYKRNFHNLSFGHKLIRNYNNIIKHSSYLNIEIGQIYYLKGEECVCIIKTFWIKIIQRAWKKIYQMRKRIYQLRNRPDSIMYRQITGKWKENCVFLPSIRGMLL